jgi:hypothetical protein
LRRVFGSPDGWTESPKNHPRAVSNPSPLDLFLGHLLVPAVVDPGRVRGGVPGDVLSRPIFQKGRDAGGAERVAGNLGQVKVHVLPP